MHLVSFPHALVNFVVGPDVFSKSRYLIVLKLACIGGAIGKSENSIAVLFAVLVAALVLGTIRPLFNTSPMLLVFTPLTHV